MRPTHYLQSCDWRPAKTLLQKKKWNNKRRKKEGIDEEKESDADLFC